MPHRSNHFAEPAFEELVWRELPLHAAVPSWQHGPTYDCTAPLGYAAGIMCIFRFHALVLSSPRHLLLGRSVQVLEVGKRSPTCFGCYTPRLGKLFDAACKQFGAPIWILQLPTIAPKVPGILLAKLLSACVSCQFLHRIVGWPRASIARGRCHSDCILGHQTCC